METPTFRCPICRRTVQKADNAFFPFCTERCRTVDLGKWFDGAYRFAVTSSDEDDDGLQPITPRTLPEEDA